MTKIISFLVLGFLFLSCGEGKTPVDKKKELLDNACNKIMQKFAEGNFSDALIILKQNSVLSASSIDTLKVTNENNFKNVFASYGKIRGYEFISEHKAKNVIAKRLYLLKLNKFYVKFEFTLYNNGDKWTIASFVYNEDVLELLY